MMIRSLSRKEIEANFNSMLQEAIDLGIGGETTDTGVDSLTQGAIIAVAQDFPNPDAALIRNARKEFAKQLDGTHQREEAAHWQNY
jgi:hypothetical protein